jgi:hypothetical protein
MNDRLAVDVLEIRQDPGFQFGLGSDRMYRSMDRVILEKKPSIRLSQDPCCGVNIKVRRPSGCAASQALVSLDTWMNCWV